MKAVVASAWLAVLLTSAYLAASEDTVGISVTAARLAVQPRHDYRSPWPEWVGMSSEEAKNKICENWTCAHVHVVPAGYLVTMDYNTERVRIFLDSNDKVARVRIG